jgi:hypothetical protein
MKHILSIILRVLALTVIYIILLTVGGGITTPPEVAKLMSAEQTAAFAAVLPLVGLMMTATLAYLALRSRWHGWKLAGALFIIFFTVYTFLSWIEVLAFPAVGNRMPPGMRTSMLFTGLIVGIPFSVIAVWILGKTRRDRADAQLPARLQMPFAEWAWKLAAAAILYVIVYFAFGYYVAWRTPGLPEFYGGSDPGTFIGQLGNVMRDSPWLPPFQILRGLVWAGVGCIIVAMHKGRAWEAALATGLAFMVLMTASMLFPNPFMTPLVQHAHTIELLTSNMLFGVLLGLLLMWPLGNRETAAERGPATAQ